jgi:calcium/calmodulin-dependent protein kinase I
MGNEPGKTSKKEQKKNDKNKQTVSDIPKERLIFGPHGNIEEHYQITTLLGTGNFSQVKKGISKHTKELVAIKIIDKKRVKHKPEMMANEVEILIKIDHKYVIKLLDLFDTPEYLYLVMELVTGGELFDRIVEREAYSEADAKEVIHQLLDALEYIHSKDIVHRDLKPENLLLETEASDTNIKLSDFGLSKILDTNEFLRTACGTIGYVAPEVLAATGYGPAVDMWSAGVILYILLCGYPPFYNDNDAVLFESILNAKYSFHSPYWDHISKQAKDLIRALLVVDPIIRLTAAQAKEMEWFSVNTTTAALPLPAELKENLIKWRTSSKLRIPNTSAETLIPTVDKKKNS